MRAERELLRARGIEVLTFDRHNDTLTTMFAAELRSAASNVWSLAAQRQLEQTIRKHRPDIAHFHNTFPQISISGYAACAALGVPIVQTLHNFRMFCANGLLLREGRPCTDCVGNWPWPALRHRCYRGSLAATAAMSTAIVAHKVSQAHVRYVARFVALTEFAAKIFASAGIPTDRLQVRGNALARDPGVGRGDGGYALFIGRLSTEKGVSTLIDAWRNVSTLPLHVVGDGELRTELQARATGLPVQFFGRLPTTDVLEQLKSARMLIVPSQCYEGFPRVIVEAFATGTPIVASRLGGLAELVERRCGVTFRPGDSADLAGAVNALHSDEATVRAMRAANRARYLAQFAPDQAFASLMTAYRAALARDLSNGSAQLPVPKP